MVHDICGALKSEFCEKSIAKYFQLLLVTKPSPMSMNVHKFPVLALPNFILLYRFYSVFRVCASECIGLVQNFSIGTALHETILHFCRSASSATCSNYFACKDWVNYEMKPVKNPSPYHFFTSSITIEVCE